MIDINKKYTYNGNPVRIYADGSDTDNREYHCGVQNEDKKWTMKSLYGSDLVEVWEPKEERISMTKEKLIETIKAYSSDLSDDVTHDLYKFFSQNVCIPKGENRHEYADVMHAKAEDIHLPIQFKEKHDAEFQDTIYPAWDIKTEYRIKPSEYTYPMFFKSIPYQAIVRFDNINTITYIEDSPIDSSYRIGYYQQGVHPHTDNRYWTQVEEPSEPVYEWQWLDISNSKCAELMNKAKHMTEDEVKIWVSNIKPIKIEATKRVRQ